MSNTPLSHPSHSEQLGRLKRIEGQVRGIHRMIEEDRYCVDILIQLRAVRAALKKVEGNILNRHMQHCVSQAMGDSPEAQSKVAELMSYFAKE